MSEKIEELRRDMHVYGVDPGRDEGSVELFPDARRCQECSALHAGHRPALRCDCGGLTTRLFTLDEAHLVWREAYHSANFWRWFWWGAWVVTAFLCAWGWTR